MPHNVKAPVYDITKDTKELLVKVTTQKDSPAGQHQGVFAQVIVPEQGENVLHNVGGTGAPYRSAAAAEGERPGRREGRPTAAARGGETGREEALAARETAAGTGGKGKSGGRGRRKGTTIAMTKALMPFNLERMERAHQLVHERLLRIAKALDAKEIPYLVIGGKAVQYWMLQECGSGDRATPHVDLLIHRRDLERTVSCLGNLGFKHFHVRNCHRFQDLENPNRQPAVQLFFAGEKYKDTEQFPHPELSDGVWSQEEYRVVSLDDLVHMKLNAYRLIDKVHLYDLINADVIGREWCGRVARAWQTGCGTCLIIRNQTFEPHAHNATAGHIGADANGDRRRSPAAAAYHQAAGQARHSVRSRRGSCSRQLGRPDAAVVGAPDAGR